MAQLTCRDLALGYEGKTVVEHLDFTVEKGDYLCIVGENGSGKSTLMKTLLHLKKPVSYTHLAARRNRLCKVHPPARLAPAKRRFSPVRPPEAARGRSF